MSLSHRLPPGAPAVDPYYVYAPHPDPHRQGILTLFVAGLPDDVKPREIHNLFSHRPGFDHCLLEYTGRGNQAVAFVTFFTHEAALSAMTSLNGTIFDPETGDRLHIELAKSTSRRPRGGGDVYRVIDKRANKTEGNADHENSGDEGGEEAWEEDEDGGNDDSGDGGSDEPSGTENENFSDKNELPADQSGLSLMFPLMGSDQPAHKQQNGQSPSNDGRDKSSSDIPPCSTLFIANLGRTCTEDELKEVLSKEPGFHVLKMRRRSGMPVAFADFTDIESSTAAMNSLQGTVLASSDNDGLHIEYPQYNACFYCSISVPYLYIHVNTHKISRGTRQFLFSCSGFQWV
ncbi:hypothetical protein C2845_PM10G02840 [Panicum miliaceum]|uniref:RRM domain-containing protein n=1 Tax=Panicum miliaceum TaxID=4540 RepID=A0A3L6PDU0_PANMI|nr:hypothetical protein C2845_PM10G02840 [Panicum miliaceum]